MQITPCDLNFLKINFYGAELIYSVLLVSLCVGSVAQSCLTFCNPIDCSLPGSSDHGFPGESTGLGCHFLLQESSQPRDWTCISCVSCTGRQILYHCTTREALVLFLLIYASYLWYPFKALSFLIETFLLIWILSWYSKSINLLSVIFSYFL